MKLDRHVAPFPFEFHTLPQIYKGAAEAYQDLPVVAAPLKTGDFKKVSYAEMYELGLNLATALIDNGLRPREHVGILADNRIEWLISDYGILISGAANVPRGTDITEQEIVYILTHGDVELVFVENAKILEKLENVRDRLPAMLQVIMMDKDTPAPDGVLHLYNLLAQGEELRRNGDTRAEERIAQTKAEDLFTIIYTSGTTGTPKGVQLTHANMVSQLRNVSWEILKEDRMLSILPIWHSYERVCEVISIGRGACTYYTNIRRISEDLKAVRPTMMASAPRLWESVYQKIKKNVETAPPARQKLFNVAYFCSRMVQGSWYFLAGRTLDLTGRSLPEKIIKGAFHAVRALIFLIPYLILDKVVLSKLRQVVGGAFRGTVSGGGALPPYVDEFFNYIGIPVLEGYGMTETTPVSAVRTKDKLIIGTVGPLVNNTQVRIISLENGEILYPNPGRKGEGRGMKGEIHIKGPQVMKGYYKMPDETARVLKEGWMNTGDIGMVTYNDCLKIMGRSKETIVLLSGENVEPNPIEDKLKESPKVDHCMVIGNDEKHLAALIIPSLEFYQNNGQPSVQTLQELVELPQVQQDLELEAKVLVNQDNGFKPFERVLGIHLIGKPFELGQELTNTYKLKRHVITEMYEEAIDRIYGRD